MNTPEDAMLFQNRQFVCTNIMCHHIFDPRDITTRSGGYMPVCPVCKKGFIALYVNMHNIEFADWEVRRDVQFESDIERSALHRLNPEEIQNLSKEELDRISKMRY